jgi:hypothetical protein
MVFLHMLQRNLCADSIWVDNMDNTNLDDARAVVDVGRNSSDMRDMMVDNAFVDDASVAERIDRVSVPSHLLIIQLIINNLRRQ